ncbi:MAG: hypothetical protein LJE64_01180 [Desulfofustis sp.]|nr:hypothetical protein [Desulfofustis sp.]
MRSLSGIYFDQKDYQLLDIVNGVLERDSSAQTLRSLLGEHMHPQGIKEMAATRALRIAYAIAGLLDTFVTGTAGVRLKALRSLRDEVLLTDKIFYQRNTARVLTQIMKELLRSRGDRMQQLELAHDFRLVSTGTPQLVRKQLAKYYLLEMPEDWSQYAFDNHVHDASTKGRKSPTHLIMDAWIKGIRHLTVVYYNFVDPEITEELIEAGSILDIHVQVGIELSAPFRDKYVRFIWELHRLRDIESYLKFLDKQDVVDLMDLGRAVSRYQQKYVFDVLGAFNTVHRQAVSKDLGLNLEALSLQDFLAFVGAGQPSLLHLARFIHSAIMKQAGTESSDELSGGDQNSIDAIGKDQRSAKRFSSYDIETIITRFLMPSSNPDIHDPARPQQSGNIPELLRSSPRDLMRRLLTLHSSSEFTLNLSNLSLQDILELIYDCEGMINYLESYNLKDASHGLTQGLSTAVPFAGEAVALRSPSRFYTVVGELQAALNDDNVIALKRVIRDVIWDFEEERLQLKRKLDQLTEDQPNREAVDNQYQHLLDRKKRLLDILFNLETFHNFYKKRTLGSRIGTSSTGRAEIQHGMGLVVLDTLPIRVRRVVSDEVDRKRRVQVPVIGLLTRNIHRRVGYHDDLRTGGWWHRLYCSWIRRGEVRKDWSLDRFIVDPGRPGNVFTLGGLGAGTDNNSHTSNQHPGGGLRHAWAYLNTNLKNTLKVLIGFIPAFLTFFLTKDWWLLAYFGAVIWFGITASRNIIQSVLGGGGLRRSPLLPWNSLVSWSRISDSLLYTGFSVPLLDYLVKTLVLDHGFGITTSTDPITLYAVMGVANGLYICSHNLFRGLPRSAAAGNLFRSTLAIPLAIFINGLIGGLLQVAGVTDVSGELQKWAAIISKFSSDCVAAVIEGLADRQTNIEVRLRAYRSKIAQIFAVFSRLDLLFPEDDVLDVLQSPKMVLETLDGDASEQETLLIVNALDLMYFWMYQPRARKALQRIVEGMDREQWLIFYRSQLVLKRYREISQVFVNGLVGKNFSKALSFYLDRSEEYLADLQKLGARVGFS